MLSRAQNSVILWSNRLELKRSLQSVAFASTEEFLAGNSIPSRYAANFLSEIPSLHEALRNFGGD